jgi:hypothetical protein
VNTIFSSLSRDRRRATAQILNPKAWLVRAPGAFTSGEHDIFFFVA